MDDPLKHCSDLKAIFGRQAGAWLDGATLARVRKLCQAAFASDPAAGAELRRVEDCAEQLYSHRDRRIDTLREEVLFRIEAMEHRARRG